MTEIICSYCNKPIFGSDHLSKMIRTKYHQGCREKVNKLNKIKSNNRLGATA